MPIPGFKGYEMSLVTQEITNKWGRPVKKRHDSRGRLVVSLTKDNGNRTVASVRQLAEKTVKLLCVRKEQDGILPKVLVAYYQLLDTDIASLTLQQQANAVKKDVPELDVLEIGRILSKFKQNANLHNVRL